jgi:hypothetical protein
MIATGRKVDEILVGCLVGKRLRLVESVRAGFVPLTRRKTFEALVQCVAADCPFVNLRKKGPGRFDREKMTGAK